MLQAVEKTRPLSNAEQMWQISKQHQKESCDHMTAVYKAAHIDLNSGIRMGVDAMLKAATASLAHLLPADVIKSALAEAAAAALAAAPGAARPEAVPSATGRGGEAAASALPSHLLGEQQQPLTGTEPSPGNNAMELCADIRTSANRRNTDISKLANKAPIYLFKCYNSGFALIFSVRLSITSIGFILEPKFSH